MRGGEVGLRQEPMPDRPRSRSRLPPQLPQLMWRPRCTWWSATTALHIPQVDMAVDCGRYVNPEGVKKQIEGAAIYGNTVARHGLNKGPRGERSTRATSTTIP